MKKMTFLFCLFTMQIYAQPYYTPIRAAFGAEILGTSPRAQAYAEALFGYRPKSFWDIQVGLGWVSGSQFSSLSLSSALTYSYLLNPYRRKSCRPYPGYNSFESYVESGLASFYVDTYDNKSLPDLYKQRLITPLALIGFKFHIVAQKWVYIIKLRYTPALAESKLASRAGIAIGLGWR